MQAENRNKYLKFTSLPNLVYWDYYTLFNENTIKSNFPLVKLKEVLNHRKEFITINDSNFYKRCRVQIQGRGVVLRDEVIGKEIKTKKQQLCKPEEFLVAEIDAKVGGYGIVPNDLENAIVSGHYFLFEIDKKKLLPEFLGIVVKQMQFSKQVKSTGSTNYSAIRPSHVLNYLIPLPSLEEQKALVYTYNKKMDEAESLKQKANNLFNNINEYFLNQLGIEKNQEKLVQKGLQIINSETIERWDVWVNKNTISDGSYKSIAFKEIVIGKPIYGANVKGVKVKSDTRYVRITDINENGTLNHEFVSPEFVEEKYLLKENDFLIARSGNTVGKTFLYKEKYGRAIYAGYLVKYNIDYNKIIPEYLLEYTKSFTFKNWITSNQRVAGQPNINGQEFLQAPLILPPIQIQKEIVEKTTTLKKQISKYYSHSEIVKTIAETEFENAIFKCLK